MPESTRQRHGLDRYWDLGPERSIERLYAALSAEGPSVSLRTLYSWSSRYRWQDRIARMEREAREAGEQARIEALREMYQRQAKEALLLQQRGTEWLAAFVTEDASPEAAIRAIVEGAKLERLARGEPTERLAAHEEERDERFSRFTDEELELLATQVDRGLGGAARPQPE